MSLVPAQLRHLCALVVFVLALAALAAAQSATSGVLSGTVTDPTGAVVPGVRVTASNLDTGLTAHSLTGNDGVFRLLDLPPGAYAVEFARDGFRTHRSAHEVVEIGRVTRIEVRFAIAGRNSDTVNVTDEAPMVNNSQPDFSTNFDQAMLDDLPSNGRRWSDLALLTPLATADGDYGLISFRGISGMQNSSTVDGGDNTQAFFGEERGRTRISYVISQASVREFQVNGSNFSAEYGRSAGGAVNAVTRSGTNHVHGQVFYHVRDNALGATNAYTYAPHENADGSFSALKIKPGDRRQQFGGAVGGPILRDRLFYFFAFDEQRRDYPAVAAASDPTMFFEAPVASELTRLKVVMPYGTTPAGLQAGWQGGMDFLAGLLGTVPRRNHETVILPKLDYRLNRSHTLSVSYNRMRWYAPAGVQSSPVVNLGADALGNDGVKVDTLLAALHSALGTHAANQLRVSYGRDFEYAMPHTPLPGEPAVGPYHNVPSVSVERGWDGFTFGMPETLPRFALPDEHRLHAADTLSIQRGHHQLKTGFDFIRTHDRMSNLYAAGGSYNYTYRDSFVMDLLQWQNWGVQGWPGSVTPWGYAIPADYGYSSYTQGFGRTTWEFSTLDAATFVQDDWRATRRLLLSFGLRGEQEFLPPPQAPNPLLPLSQHLAFSGNNLGPRFGFVWDVTGHGHTVIRGGYGIFYGRISNSTVSSALADTGTQDSQRTYAWFGYKKKGPLFPYAMTADPYSATNQGDVAVLAKGLRLPQVQQMNLAAEHEVAHNTVVSAAYLLSLGRHLTNFLDTNLDPEWAQPVTYTFANDPKTNQPGPYRGTLTVPVITRRIDPRFQQITQVTSNVSASFNALVVTVRRRMTRGLQFQAHYTWAHALDDGQTSTTFTTGNNTLYPFPLTYTYNGKTVTAIDPNYGSSNFDIRHRLSASAIWEPRFVRRKGVAARALNGWALSPIMRISSGRPFSDYIYGTPNGTCDGCTGYMGTGGQMRLPFTSRNSYRYPSIWNADLRLSRRIRLCEGQRLELIVEAFNLLNHRNVTGMNDGMYAVSGTKLTYTPSFGKAYAAGSSVYREREVQLAARWRF